MPRVGLQVGIVFRRMESTANTTFTVFVDDNYHYMDESERCTESGEFDTFDQAVARCKEIVDEFLMASYRPGITASELYQTYTGFGEDPFILPSDEKARFSAWDYAKQRCSELCGKP